MTQWDFQNKGKSGWSGKSSFVLKVPLRYLRPSVIYSVPCDQILQRAYWSRYNLCHIATKASVAFVVSMDPDVHFRCCISADSKVQASIKHEREVKPIQACPVHSGAIYGLTSQRSTGKCSLLLFFKFGHIACLKFLEVIRLVGGSGWG